MKITGKKPLIFLLTAAVAMFSAGVFFTEPLKADPDYGSYAYEYLRELTDNYPYRVNNKDILPNQDAKLAAGEWINSIMTSFGYTPRIITNDWNPSREFGNYVRSYCYRKPGNSNKRIVIGAHYDSVMTKGTEDNGTGVSVVMELARRLKDVPTRYSLEFCFWDGEETLGFGGSFNYVRQCLVDNDVRDIVLYINLDCVGSGDRLLVCGGQYEDNLLVQSWGYNMTRALLDELGIDYMTLPKEGTALRPPESLSGSDQHFFATQDVPYVYFLCTAIYDENGQIFYPAAPSKFHTADPRVTAGEGYIRGQIIHTPFDDLDVLEELFPGRIRQHFNDVERIVVELINRIT
ncbi:MAG: M28 family peptidase, partial [Lachnospiraceae bacterium]|nr:M28 family peptidase [Lachnospiraceae bacterium]